MKQCSKKIFTYILVFVIAIGIIIIYGLWYISIRITILNNTNYDIYNVYVFYLVGAKETGYIKKGESATITILPTYQSYLKFNVSPTSAHVLLGNSVELDDLQNYELDIYGYINPVYNAGEWQIELLPDRRFKASPDRPPHLEIPFAN